MPRNIVQDVVPPDRSIRKIPVPERQKVTPARSVKYGDTVPASTSRFSRKRKSFLWAPVAVLLFVLAAVFFSSVLLTSATVTLEPRRFSVEADIEINSEQVGGGLTHDVVTIEKSSNKLLPSTEKKVVHERALGKIVIFNRHSSAVQRLVRNTRFESPEGLIFRINESVSVPGTTAKAGETIPGSIEVDVYAEEPGEKYNIGLVDFTLPGFKGDAKFKTIFARSKTSMSGGKEGEVFVAAEDDIARAKSELEQSLTTTVLDELSKTVPENFIYFPGAISTDFSSKLEDVTNGNAVRLSVTAIANAALFLKDDFASTTAAKLIPEYSGHHARIADYSLFSLTKLGDARISKDADNLSFSLKGNGVIEYVVPVRQIQESLIDLAEQSVKEYLASESSVHSATIVIRPFWRNTMPSNADKIEIKITDFPSSP